MALRRRVAALAAALALLAGAAGAQTDGRDLAARLSKPDGALRIAVFNTHLARGAEGKLIDELRGDALAPEQDLERTRAQMAAIAEIVQRVDPDVLALLEVDYDPADYALLLVDEALRTPRGDAPPFEAKATFTRPVNTGVASGFDLDGDGKTNGPADAFGWGVFEGQFGMAVLSKLPIDAPASRTFQNVLWSAAPGATAPIGEDGAPFYPDEIWRALRLSSKSHWDVVIETPTGARLHILLSHPTPPVFDGPEDRNGLRNAAEIAFWRDYIDGADWMTDDAGAAGGLAPGASFVLLGDLNADPRDGDGVRAEIQALLEHPRLQDPRPASAGGAAAAAAQAGANDGQAGDPRLDTADWRDDRGPGNLRVDYALPSRDLDLLGGGVFWPAPDDPLYRLVGGGWPIVSSDHRLVWVDIAPPR